MNTFQKSAIYENPPKNLDGWETYDKHKALNEMASSIGLTLEWSTDDLFVAVLNPDGTVPPAWGVLASPLALSEAWHWLNGYAAGLKAATQLSRKETMGQGQ